MSTPGRTGVRLAALGDSLFAGFGLRPEEALPQVLEDLLRAGGLDVEVLNFGISGETAGDGLERLHRVLAAKPDGLLVEFGTNDFFLGLPPEEIESALEAILGRAEQAGLPCLLVGVRSLPVADPDYCQAFDLIHPRLAERHGVPLLPDILACFMAEKGAEKGAEDDLTLMDGLHPNAAGARKAAEALLPLALELAAKIETRPGPA